MIPTVVQAPLTPLLTMNANSWVHCVNGSNSYVLSIKSTATVLRKRLEKGKHGSPNLTFDLET